jgi:hypothetical protein
VLAELAKAKLRAKIPAPKEALVGRLDRQHALIVSAILAHLDFLDQQIRLLSGEIEVQLAPFGKAVEPLATIPGVQRRHSVRSESRRRAVGRLTAAASSR